MVVDRVAVAPFPDDDFADCRFVWPDEFAEPPVGDPWPGQMLDVDTTALEIAAGPELAAALAGVGPLDAVGELTAISAWHRLGAWVKAQELAAVAAFIDRRTRETGGSRGFESAAAEIRLELTLTGYGTDRLLELALPLSQKLPATLAALGGGVIDEAKARIIAGGVAGIGDAAVCRAVEDRVLPKAGEQTSSRLRAAVARAVIEVDPPAAAERRRQQAEAGRRVELRATDAHTADLCGRDLPAELALAADARINALARSLKTDGDPNTLQFLRAQVLVSLLLGTGPRPTWPNEPDEPDEPDEPAEPAEAGEPVEAAKAAGTGTAGHDSSAITAAVHVTVPLEVVCGDSQRPGEVPGYGPVPAAVARALAARAGRRWCISLVDADGRMIAHGHAHRGGDHPEHDSLTAALAEQPRQRECQFVCDPPDEAVAIRHAQGAYRPGRLLRHYIEARDRTCVFPGCRRPARQCDLDHTRPYDDHGPTCHCNLSPLCRTHHQLKQLNGWKLNQPEPGHLIWTTPSGKQYTFQPDPYPNSVPLLAAANKGLGDDHTVAAVGQRW